MAYFIKDLAELDRQLRNQLDMMADTQSAPLRNFYVAVVCRAPDGLEVPIWLVDLPTDYRAADLERWRVQVEAILARDGDRQSPIAYDVQSGQIIEGLRSVKGGLD